MPGHKKSSNKTSQGLLGVVCRGGLNPEIRDSGVLTFLQIMISLPRSGIGQEIITLLVNLSKKISPCKSENSTDDRSPEELSQRDTSTYFFTTDPAGNGGHLFSLKSLPSVTKNADMN